MTNEYKEEWKKFPWWYRAWSWVFYKTIGRFWIPESFILPDGKTIEMSTKKMQIQAPYQKHSTTSKAAAEEIDSSVASLRAKVYKFILSRGDHGATDLEVQVALDLAGNTQRPRRCELKDAKLIKDSGIRRKTPTGREAVVWVVTDATETVDFSSLKKVKRPPRLSAKQKAAALKDLRVLAAQHKKQDVEFPENLKRLGEWLAGPK